MSVQIAKASSAIPIVHDTAFKRKRSISGSRPRSRKSSLTSANGTEGLIMENSVEEERHSYLKSTPFLLYVYKRSSEGQISHQMIVLYCEDEVQIGSDGKSIQGHLIKGSRIPVSFDSEVTSLAFAVAFGTERSVEIISDLTCCLDLNSIETNECVVLQNDPKFIQQRTHNSTLSSTPPSHIQNEANRMRLTVSRKGEQFVEIEDLRVRLSETTVKKILPSSSF
eukprot:TRINITY_DN1154_c0_g1_i2.p1 TRINITY_DN1154_c0_g1~~TRINITY_DN1154_c0_g1_i2.p1  ORF type:complete len:224 (+),score=32.10 TRINITY_DN1154_c0_g1_i2:282-953(+)